MRDGQSRTWRPLALLLLVALVASVAIPAAWAAWGGTPEARSRVLATPDGVAVSALNPLPVSAAVVVPPSQVDAATALSGAAVPPTRALQLAGVDPDSGGTFEPVQTMLGGLLTYIYKQAVMDYDTDPGDTSTIAALGIAVPSASGPVAGGTTTAPLRQVSQAGVASAPASDTVAAGADDSIAAVAGQQAICVQSRDADGIVCVGGAGGTGATCAAGIALSAASADGLAGGAVCLPSTATVTVGASVAGPLTYVWWRI